MRGCAASAKYSTDPTHVLDNADYAGPTRPQHGLGRTRSGIDLAFERSIDHEVGMDDLCERCETFLIGGAPRPLHHSNGGELPNLLVVVIAAVQVLVS